MKKLRLELEDLAVESFSIAREPEPRGTVHGNATWDYSNCNFSECSECATHYGGDACYTADCPSFGGCPSDGCPSTAPAVCGPPDGPEDPY